MSRLAPLLLVFCLACQPPVEPPPFVCPDVAQAAERASAPDRRLLGAAHDYPADASLEARLEELSASQRLRREAAWEVVARVIAPVPTAEPTALVGATVPRWRTFYDRDDFARIFRHLFSELDAPERSARARLDEAAVDDAFLFNVGFVDTLGTWPEERFQDYLATFETREQVNRIGGIPRIALSPGMTRHIAQSYPELLGCLHDGSPPAQVPSEATTHVLLREAVALGACGQTRFGPFAVGRGATITAGLEGANGARVELLEGPSPRLARVVCEQSERCEAAGPGSFFVRVQASEPGLTAALEIARTQAGAPVACLDGPLPIDAVSVAAEWRRLDPALPFPTFDTSADALRALTGDETPTWETAQSGVVEPSGEQIYTQRLESGAAFVLAGLHIRTRELPLGMNITLWWSDEPNTDFGADRPAAIAALGGAWANYKMCVSVEHTELDPDPEGGFSADAPTLGAALAAVHEGRGGPTWCSNPYIDAAPGLAVGNCVGCHQHGMSGIRPGEVATDEARFPSNGRLAARNNYPADGSWALDAGDDLAARVDEIVQFFDP